MGKFKVGDRVRAIEDCGDDEWFVVGGTNGVVVDVDSDVDVRWDGWSDSWWYEVDKVELVDPATDELATLRAFREQALARYPDLAEPESDEDAARRICIENNWASGTDAENPNDEDFVLGVAGVAYKAIAWARANPRQG